MNGTSPSRSRIVAAFAAVYLVSGSTYLGIRFAIETIPPFFMVGVRFMLAGAVLYVIARFRGGERPTLVHWRSTAIIGACLILGGNGAVVWAEQFIPSGMTALIVAMLPFWIVLIDWLGPDRARPSLGVAVGLLVGIAGITMLVGPSAIQPFPSGATAHSGNVFLLGVIALMTGSLTWALGSIYSRHARLPSSALVTTAMEMFCGGALLTTFALLTGEGRQFDLASLSARSIAGFLYLTSVGSLIGFTAYIWLLQHQPPSRVSTYAYVNPVVAVFLGWAIAGESLTIRTVIAAAIIVSAVALITTAQKSTPVPEPG